MLVPFPVILNIKNTLFLKHRLTSNNISTVNLLVSVSSVLVLVDLESVFTTCQYGFKRSKELHFYVKILDVINLLKYSRQKAFVNKFILNRHTYKKKYINVFKK